MQVFERPRATGAGSEEEDPFAIEQISMCPESRKLCIAGASGHVILFKFRKNEATGETTVLEIPIVYENSDDVDCSPEYECPRSGSTARLDASGVDCGSGELRKVIVLIISTRGKSRAQTFRSIDTGCLICEVTDGLFQDNQPTLKVRTGSQKKAPGFQAQLVCLTPWSNGEPPGHITALAINSSYGL